MAPNLLEVATLFEGFHSAVKGMRREFDNLILRISFIPVEEVKGFFFGDHFLIGAVH